MDEREQLVEKIKAELASWRSLISDAVSGVVADALLADGWVRKAPEKLTPRPVWPGLEGEKGLARNEQVWSDAHRSALERGYSPEDAVRHAVTVRTAYLFRALVAGLPKFGNSPGDYVLVDKDRAVPRASLAALADPYDGGGK